jgi:APA family basic amino acid/polyamine antiporter
MADVALTLRWRRRGERVALALAVAAAGFVYGLLAVGGAGRDYVYWGFLLQLAGVPFFVWASARR